MQKNGEKYFYLYNSSDMRIYKENQTESLQEFTLIDATGILGVKQMSTDRWELYAGTGKNAYKYTELGSSTSSETYYIHDHLGNIRLSLTADMAGNHLQSALDYDPYGHLIREYTATQSERYLTTGNERDQETQLDYRQARFYDSEIGRFLSVDPLGDRRIWLSPFNYVQNNPINRIDPTGALDWKPDANGNLISEEGDDALTLSKYLDISFDDVIDMFTSYKNWDGGNNTGGITNVKGHTLTMNDAGFRIGNLAEYNLGSTAWNYDVAKGDYSSGTNKCNIFCYDMTSGAGASPGTPNVINPGWSQVPFVDEKYGPPFAG